MSVADVSERTIGQLLSLHGRSAVVTGGARGLGHAIAMRLAEAGAAIAIGDIDVPGARRAAEGIAHAHGVDAIGLELDVTDTASVAGAVREVEARLGGITIWVNNAGVFGEAPALDMTDADWDRIMNVHLRGSFIGAREAARCMLRHGPPHGAVILNLVSGAGFRAVPKMAHYTAAKHGVIGLTRTLAAELGPSGIRVLGVAPTMTLTPGTAVADDSDFGAALEQRIVAARPLRRRAVADDLARVALFCASDLALFMTGAVIPVDAGGGAL
ncbi:MAG: SDR family NAD(P)-dependent oxidoreductase [Gammaproteobacteria bacterium]